MGRLRFACVSEPEKCLREAETAFSKGIHPPYEEKGSLSPVEQIEQRNKMATKPVFPLLMSMAFPPMLSMLVQSMYNIVDSMFVARFSQDALTAVSLAFPLQNLVLAVAVGAGA